MTTYSWNEIFIGFASVDPDTKCIRMWSEPLFNVPGIDSNTAILLMDTNGLLNPENDEFLDPFVYQFAMAISSVLIINVQRTVTEPFLKSLIGLGNKRFPDHAMFVIRDRADDKDRRKYEILIREKLDLSLSEKKSSWFGKKAKQSIVPVAMLPFPGNIVNENRVGSINYAEFSNDFKSCVTDLYYRIFLERESKHISWDASLLYNFVSAVCSSSIADRCDLLQTCIDGHRSSFQKLRVLIEQIFYRENMANNNDIASITDMETNDTPSLEADLLEKFKTELKVLESNFILMAIDEKIYTIELLQSFCGTIESKRRKSDSDIDIGSSLPLKSSIKSSK